MGEASVPPGTCASPENAMIVLCRALGLSVLCLALASCSAGPVARGGDSPRGSSGALVLRMDQMRATAASLLTVMRGRISGMELREGAETCPEIRFRGTRSVFGDNSPAIYVDGIRTSNTCVLGTLTVADVDRVEVYSMGIAPRPPYQSDPNGLILVFLETGRQ